MNFFEFHPTIRLRIVVIFLNTLTSNMVFPFMSIYFALNIGIVYASAAISIGIIINFFSGVYWGFHSDRIGRKKIMIYSDGLKMASYIALAIFNSPWISSPVLTLIIFLLHTFSTGMYGPASEAMLLDLTKSEQRKYMYSIIYWTQNLSIAIAGIIGSLLFKEKLFFLFIGLVFSSLVSLVVTCFFISESFQQPSEAKLKQSGFKDLLQNYRLVISDRVFIIFVISSMLLFSIESHLANYLSIRFESSFSQYTFEPLQWSFNGIQLIGYLRTENTIGIVIFTLFVGLLLKRFSDKKLLFIGYSLYLIGYVAISISMQPGVLFLMMFVAVFGEVLFTPIHESFLGDITPNHLRSSYLALNKIAYKGSALIGAVGIYLSSMLPAWAMSIFILISGLVAIVLFYSIFQAIQIRKLTTQTNSTEAEVTG
ncbi:MFS transporter, DHA1 family, multidrug resistance protein B [Paenibacillus polysaccharolyticus]|uniref:MFS transporter, DHA1 family, multidrug resistance protein B n=1 Tax=Paenibacillus polysaccharolyticus TaxID=582692 RepID=A0A1G5E2S9_9BACL|nr:MFS transporter [Paenibacillus polysaccharolyticus]SCY21165.1 MFS transporter, DHA1 family, multidrug resistance protein B [Paenibacillus polysaccharolyticus]